jgi:hypothetical protein
LVSGFFLVLSLAGFLNSLQFASQESTFSSAVSSLALELVWVTIGAVLAM